ncbi:uncharacterized protein LOC143186687 [Calliopsis andreniformis]|uniref:uncharacterized protein LOC143186687 n=1 Tax=Calliopsis andreniformis TaxID=337506 RepID=UPI003FCD1691
MDLTVSPQLSASDSSPSTTMEDPSIIFDIIGTTESNSIINVPFEVRKQVFIMRRLYVPKGNRCCPNHLIKNRFFRDIVSNLRVHSNTSLIDVNELKTYFEYIANTSDSSITDKVGDFTLSEERLKVFSGLTWENLIELREMMTSMRNSEKRDVTQAIVVFLFKLRTVIKSFEKDILSVHFGFSAISHEHLIQNETSHIAKELHNIGNQQLALIFDGTYIRHQKCTNNEYERKSYSGQKKVPLCKPFTICTTNGYMVDMLGPFYANQNDAQIMKIVLQDPHGLQSLMKRGDICIVDRGFRDIQSHLEECGFQVLMPALKGKRNQLTTLESNTSRKVTKVRWVVKAIHGIIGQKYKLLHYQLDNKIQDQQNVENTLATEVENRHWNRREVPFRQVSVSDFLDFPEMTQHELKILFTGSYQLSRAVSYLAELMDSENNINIHCLKENNDIVKFQDKWRHINSKTYRCYIDYTPNSIGVSGIKRYCCECPNGNRTIGCCSHVAAIIYYLSHARYLSTIVRPAKILSKMFHEDPVVPVINEDRDDD